MSDAKYEAARQLVKEKHYDAARAVLKTINEPKANDWLTRIDQLDPPKAKRTIDKNQSSGKPAPSNEAEKYYRAENRKRERRYRWGGVDMILYGVATIAFYGFFLAPTLGTLDTTSALLGTGILILSLMSIGIGLRRALGHKRSSPQR